MGGEWQATSAEESSRGKWMQYWGRPTAPARTLQPHMDRLQYAALGIEHPSRKFHRSYFDGLQQLANFFVASCL